MALTTPYSTSAKILLKELRNSWWSVLWCTQLVLTFKAGRGHFLGAEQRVVDEETGQDVGVRVLIQGLAIHVRLQHVAITCQGGSSSLHEFNHLMYSKMTTNTTTDPKMSQLSNSSDVNVNIVSFHST